jgi:hypothetical protein
MPRHEHDTRTDGHGHAHADAGPGPPRDRHGGRDARGGAGSLAQLAAARP